MADILDIVARLYKALENETPIILSTAEIDEILWTLGEKDIALELQRHMIWMLEANQPSERKTVN